MYKFRISYVYDDLDNITVIGGQLNLSRIPTGWADVYLRPLILRQELLTIAYPIQAIYPWRFGFVLRRPDYKYYKTFYSKPFIRTVWNYLYIMAMIVAILFYILKLWEYSILGGWECSFGYEVLMIIGAYCQHIPPMDAKLPSRRIAYFIFFMFSYIVYTFYTSNLLSGLVNDHENSPDLQMLADGNYELVIVNYMRLSLAGSLSSYGHNITVLIDKLKHMRSVSVPEGVEDVLESKVALLSDYATIYPYIVKSSIFVPYSIEASLSVEA
ncbi:unnamed protein product [Chrysodeixis includens]|uniref:Uncharacterized protein n=1 Tax=Chrysodeixis includens TaxID=689277 RepID=A0A9N8L0E5_CHRIL|nr:unnamed protein product [Chrysodeixis includens]